MEKIYALSGVATATGLLAATTACIGCIGTGILTDGLIVPKPTSEAEIVFICLMAAGAVLTVLFILLKKWIARLETEYEDRVNPSGNELHEYRNEYYDYINSKIIH